MSTLTRYELPPGGISLLGYLCRRAHKTELLQQAADDVRATNHDLALTAVGHYAAAAAVSFGRAYYQPASSAVGDVYEEVDPATGIPVAAELLARSPVIRTRITVDGEGWRLVLDEEITGTTFGLGTLGMPAPSRFTFDFGEYSATAAGIVTTELIPLPRATRVGGHGRLELRDGAGNTGEAILSKKGLLTVTVGDRRLEAQLR